MAAAAARNVLFASRLALFYLRSLGFGRNVRRAFLIWRAHVRRRLRNLRSLHAAFTRSRPRASLQS